MLRFYFIFIKRSSGQHYANETKVLEWQTEKYIYYLDTGQNVSHDDLLTIFLRQVLAEL